MTLVAFTTVTPNQDKLHSLLNITYSSPYTNMILAYIKNELKMKHNEEHITCEKYGRNGDSVVFRNIGTTYVEMFYD